MTEHDNADEVTRLRAEVARLKRNTAGLYERTHAAEAAMTRVRELAERWEAAETWDGKPAMVDRGFGARLMLALDPASPATRPSPAPADDEGTGTEAAPSEGHSEAQGAPHWCFDCAPLDGGA